MQNRRKFISLLGLTAAAGSTAIAGPIRNIENLVKYPESETISNLVNSNKPTILPRALKKGSKVAIMAPASPTSMGEISNCVKMLKNNGFAVEIGKTITQRDNNFRYFSDSDQNRASEFMEFIERPDIDAIICGRGGYGVMRILSLLDYEKIKSNPKIIVGFSDITALLNSIHKMTGLVSFHGPVASSSFNEFTMNYFSKILFENKQFTPYEVKTPSVEKIVGGKANGKLVGGNLKLIVSTLGTPYEIETEDSILFIEEVSEHPYQIDRMLTQLALSGKLNKLNGIVFGEFVNLNKRLPFHPMKSFTVKEVIQQIISPLNIPTLVGLPIGHILSKATLPIGINVDLDADAKVLHINNPSVII